MTYKEQQKLILECLEIAKMNSPIRTGNMRYNAIRYEYIGNGKWCIYCDEDIAPYFPYTQYPWISPIWRGKKNPNEGWWDRVQESIAIHIATALHGTVNKG